MLKVSYEGEFSNIHKKQNRICEPLTLSESNERHRDPSIVQSISLKDKDSYHT